jgi:hypothetical protein
MASRDGPRAQEALRESRRPPKDQHQPRSESQPYSKHRSGVQSRIDWARPDGPAYGLESIECGLFADRLEPDRFAR